MKIQFAVGSCPCWEGLSPDSPVILSPQTLHFFMTFLNSNLTWKQWTKSHSVDMPLQIPTFFMFYCVY